MHTISHRCCHFTSVATAFVACCRTYESGPLPADHVEVRVTHNGLCRTDVHMRDDDWGGGIFPLVAGHEVIGVVTAVGSAVSSRKVGDRVGYGFLRNSCRCCDRCVRGEENICVKGYDGTITNGNHGGFAE